MFTGIVKNTALLISKKPTGTNIDFVFSSDLTPQLHIDQSIAHNGTCLTITEIDSVKNTYTVTAIKETLDKTNLSDLNLSDRVNLELCLGVSDKLDGHFVQGHVDTTASVDDIKNQNGSWQFFITIHNFDPELVVPKGSITINGVSLTISEINQSSIRLDIIPYTLENTNFSSLKKGSIVNIEYDILGKYIQRKNKVAV